MASQTKAGQFHQGMLCFFRQSHQAKCVRGNTAAIYNPAKRESLRFSLFWAADDHSSEIVDIR